MKTLPPAALALLLNCSSIYFAWAAGAAPAADAAGLRKGLFANLRHRKDLALSTSQVVAKLPGPSAQTDEVVDPINDIVDDPAETAKAAVPPPPADVDGFPALPELSSMADSSAETLKKMQSQAAVLEARIAQTQMENDNKLTREKTAFEQELKSQEQANRAVMAQNNEMSTKIAAVTNVSASLTKQAHQLQEENRLKRAQLSALQGKVATATEFVAASIKVAGDQNKRELALLQGGSAVADFRHKTALASGASEQESSEDQGGTARALKQDESREVEDEDEEDGVSFLQKGQVSVEFGASGLKQTKLGKLRTDQIANIETRLKRAELKMLEAKLKIAGEFVMESLKATVESGAHELDVLQTKPGPLVSHQPKQKHHPVALVTTDETKRRSGVAVDAGDGDEGDERELERSVEEEKDEEEEKEERGDDAKHGAEYRDEEEDDDDSAGFSFLALSTKVRRASTEESADLQMGSMSELERTLVGQGVDGEPTGPATNPDDLVKVLSSGIATLATQKKSNSQKLKTSFVKAFKTGKQRHTSLLAQQRTLNSTHTSALALQAKLVSAKKHLEGTRGDLDERVQSIDSFLHGLGQLGAAQVEKIEEILKVPAGVTSSSKAKESKIVLADTRAGHKSKARKSVLSTKKKRS